MDWHYNLIAINCTSEPLNHQGKPLKYALLNARSIRKRFKSLLVNDYIVDHDIDLCVIKETWLHGDNSDEFYCREICPDGYKIDNTPRTYAIYRPPPSADNRFTVKLFLDEFSTF